MGDKQGAIKDLNKAIDFYPANENLYFERGNEKIATFSTFNGLFLIGRVLYL